MQPDMVLVQLLLVQKSTATSVTYEIPFAFVHFHVQFQIPLVGQLLVADITLEFRLQLIVHLPPMLNAGNLLGIAPPANFANPFPINFLDVLMIVRLVLMTP